MIKSSGAADKAVRLEHLHTAPGLRRRTSHHRLSPFCDVLTELRFTKRSSKFPIRGRHFSRLVLKLPGWKDEQLLPISRRAGNLVPQHRSPKHMFPEQRQGWQQAKYYKFNFFWVFWGEVGSLTPFNFF